MASILLIDDDLNLLQMVKLMLTRAGHDVEIARDGEQGVSLARELHPDVAIVDVMMPDISGYDVIRILRSDPATATIPLIMLTARSQPMDRHMALEAGANAFLSKPVTSRELLARLEAVIRAGAAFRVHTDLLTEPIPRPAPGGPSAPAQPPASRPPITPAPGTISVPQRADAPPPPTTPPPPPITPLPLQGMTRSGKPISRRIPIGVEDLPEPVTTRMIRLPVVTVISLRGGTGTTTVAVNLALLISMLGERVALADFSTTSGHVHLHMHLTAQKHWGQLLAQGDHPNPDALNQLLTLHASSGISILAAPALPPAQPLTTVASQNVLRELNGTFSRLVVDARSLDTGAVGALTVSSVVLIVMADDPPSIQSTGQLLIALKNLGVDPGRVRLVLNHVRATTDVPVETIQKALKRPLNAELPYSPGHLTAIRRGVPVALSNIDEPFCQALNQLARALMF